MKKELILTVFLMTLLFLVFWPGCKSKDDETEEPQSGWTDADNQYLEAMETLQLEGVAMFNNFLNTQDTAEAINSLAQWFEGNAKVEWAEPGSQGVMIQYKNGFRGGYLVDGEDRASVSDNEKTTGSLPSSIAEETFKSVVNKKRGIFFNPHYRERKTYFNSLLAHYATNYPNVFESFSFDTAYQCKLDHFTILSDYGYIHFYSHGIAWPKKQALAEVYLMTGESPSRNTNTKYSDLIKTGDIIACYISGIKRNVYCISPAFIRKYNDFSKDTVLMFGGFCYSFRGSWPDLQNTFANGAYFGYNWSVYTNKNANWAENLFADMADTTSGEPWTTERWMTETPEIPKEYFNSQDQVTVRINYTGDATLTLWRKTDSVFTVKSTEPDGTPVLKPGKLNTDYTFKCYLNNQDVSAGLRFIWNFDDGSPVQTIDVDNQVTHKWASSGAFVINLEIRKITTNKILKTITVGIEIESPQSILPVLYGIKHFTISLPSGGHHYLSNGGTLWDIDLTITSQDLESVGGKITWNGTSFSASGTNLNSTTINISGNVSPNGETLEYVRATRWYHFAPNWTEDSVVIELSNIPVNDVIPAYPLVNYIVTGLPAQSHVTDLYYKSYNGNTHSYDYYSHSDWEFVTVKAEFNIAR